MGLAELTEDFNCVRPKLPGFVILLPSPSLASISGTKIRITPPGAVQEIEGDDSIALGVREIHAPGMHPLHAPRVRCMTRPDGGKLSARILGLQAHITHWPRVMVREERRGAAPSGEGSRIRRKGRRSSPDPDRPNAQGEGDLGFACSPRVLCSGSSGVIAGLGTRWRSQRWSTSCRWQRRQPPTPRVTRRVCLVRPLQQVIGCYVAVEFTRLEASAWRNPVRREAAGADAELRWPCADFRDTV